MSGKQHETTWSLKEFTNRKFHIPEEKTTIKTEILAGLTSFISISYIIAVNASVLSTTGMDYGAVTVATVFSAVVGCLLMAFLANSPLIITPGMSDNAFFAFTLVGAFGLTSPQALTVVLVVGILFTLIAASKLAPKLASAIPGTLVSGMSVAIGFFVMFLGLKDGGIIVGNEGTLVALGNLSEPLPLTTLLTLLIAVILFERKVPANFLISILAGTLIGIVTGVVNLSELTDFSFSLTPFLEGVGQFDFSIMATLDFWIAVFALLMMVLFQNLGSQLSMLPDRKKMPKAFLSNAISTLTSAVLGCNSTSTTAEGATGVAAGGRTGLTSLTAGLLFIPALFILPILTLIPMSAVAPILIIVGASMIQGNIKKIPFDDFSDAFPALFTIIMTVLTFNIADGIAFGFISYTLLKVVKNDTKELTGTTVLLSIVFILYFVLNFI
ncbi:NCS2 family permease [Desemzia sp. FAM 23991]|uniref:NCS2 family permease n=1 Tax=unclassified Desemzia TaxID=2685243 RepID=UPI003885847A